MGCPKGFHIQFPRLSHFSTSYTSCPAHPRPWKWRWSSSVSLQPLTTTAGCCGCCGWKTAVVSAMSTRDVPSGKLTWLWKITMFIGKSATKGPFPMAMLVYQRVVSRDFLLKGKSEADFPWDFANKKLRLSCKRSLSLKPFKLGQFSTSRHPKSILWPFYGAVETRG